MNSNVLGFNSYLTPSDYPETFLASFFIWVMLALIIFYFLRGTKKEGKILAMSLIAGILAWVICTLVKGLIPQTVRPFRQNGFPPLTFTVPHDSSFPSGHTALAFGMAVYIYLKRHKAGIFFIILAILVGLGRILGNVHFPVDIVGGAILGVSSALLLDYLQTSLSKKG